MAKERGVNRPVDINERSTAQIDYDKTLEMHYDISGQGADEVEIKVWRLRPDSRERIFMDKAKIDGYYEADFLSNDELLSICFHSLDYEEKDLSIMLNQVLRNQMQFAKMDHVMQVTQRLKDMQDDLDVISHNMSARINYDADMQEALEQAQFKQTRSSGLKMAAVLLMCAMQTYFITCFFSAKSGDKIIEIPLKDRKATATKA